MTSSHAAELERQQLLSECHALVALIGHKRYAVRLLKAAKNGLLLYCNYKENRQHRRESK